MGAEALPMYWRTMETKSADTNRSTPIGGEKIESLSKPFGMEIHRK